jgi:hypothetical protein
MDHVLSRERESFGFKARQRQVGLELSTTHTETSSMAGGCLATWKLRALGLSGASNTCVVMCYALCLLVATLFCCFLFLCSSVVVLFWGWAVSTICACFFFVFRFPVCFAPGNLCHTRSYVCVNGCLCVVFDCVCCFLFLCSSVVLFFCRWAVSTIRACFFCFFVQ